MEYFLKIEFDRAWLAASCLTFFLGAKILFNLTQSITVSFFIILALGSRKKVPLLMARPGKPPLSLMATGFFFLSLS